MLGEKGLYSPMEDFRREVRFEKDGRIIVVKYFAKDYAKGLLFVRLFSTNRQWSSIHTSNLGPDAWMRMTIKESECRGSP